MYRRRSIYVDGIAAAMRVSRKANRVTSPYDAIFSRSSSALISGRYRK